MGEPCICCALKTIWFARHLSTVEDELSARTLMRVMPDYRFSTLNVYAVNVSWIRVDARIRTLLTIEKLR